MKNDKHNLSESLQSDSPSLFVLYHLKNATIIKYLEVTCASLFEETVHLGIHGLHKTLFGLHIHA